MLPTISVMNPVRRRSSPALAVWLVHLVIAGVIFAYMLFFADRAEGAIIQGMLMGSVTVVIALLTLLLAFFEHPPTVTGREDCGRRRWSGATSMATRAEQPTEDGRTWQERRLRWVVTLTGCAVLLGALAWIATFPASLAVRP